MRSETDRNLDRDDVEREDAPSIFEIILADHRIIEDLFDQIEATDGDERTALIERCVQELLLHTVAEEETLYARLRDEEDVREDVLEAEVEHGLVERLAQEIMSAPPNDEMLDARLMVMRDLVERHVEAEEEELIPNARGMIDDANARVLGEEMLARKSALEAEGAGAFDEELEDIEQGDVEEINASPSGDVLGRDEDEGSPPTRR